jgi:protein tyrosine/serine phosphatase
LAKGNQVYNEALMLRKRLLTPEKRYARRMKRIKRWERPLETRLDHLRAWLNMIFVDHAIFRAIYLNQHAVNEKLFRSAQPLPYHVQKWADTGIRTIINLRGGREFGSWPLQKIASEKAGLHIEDLTLRSREAPDKETIFKAKEVFERAQYPAIVHCKSGADRAGFASALFLLLNGASPQDAKKQLSFRFGHIRSSKTGILDCFIEAYAKAHAEKKIEFLKWVEEDYDKKALQASFKTKKIGAFLVDKILRRE